jgi:hypothetical protein
MVERSVALESKAAKKKDETTNEKQAGSTW